MFEKPGFRELYEGMAVDLRRRRPELTDLEEGSVVRSLFESFAYELAVLYEQMDLVYQAGFVDTATAANLDRVVAVLGISRNEPDFALGEVTFTRDPGADDAIAIPIGTLVGTVENAEETPAKKLYLTIEEGVLAANLTSVDVKVQAEERGPAMVADSGAVTVMPRPVPGVKAVTNRKPIGFRGRERETDEDLRERAKKALLASGRASATSIENALLGMPRIREVRLRERFDGALAANGGAAGAGPSGLGGPGIVEVFVDGMTAENAQQIRQRIDEVRAAGVFVVTSPARAISVQALIRIEVDAGAAGGDRATIERKVADTVYRYIDRLRMGQPLLFSQLTREVLSVKGVSDLADFRIVTFSEAEERATATMRFSRPPDSDRVLTIPSRQPLQAATGEQVELEDEVQIGQKAPSATGRARSIRVGRGGELLRSGAAVAWEPVRIGSVEIAVANETPFLLRRSTYGPDAEGKRVPATFEEILVPDLVRVASEPKPLDVFVMVRISFPNPRTQREIARSVRAMIEKIKPDSLLPADASPPLGKPTKETVAAILGTYLTAAAKRAEDLASRVYATPGEGIRKEIAEAVRTYFAAPPAPPEDPDVPAGVVEADALAVHLEALVRTLIDTNTAEVLRGPLRDRLALVLESFVAERLDAFPAAAVRDALRDGLAATHKEQSAALDREAAQLADQLGTQRVAVAEAALAMQANPASSDAYQKKQAALLDTEKKQRALDARRQTTATDQAAEASALDAVVEAIRGNAGQALAEIRSDPSLDGLVEGKTLGDRFEAEVRFRARTFEGEVRADAPRVERSLVEYLAPVVFVYASRVELTGTLTLTLPITATAEEKGVAMAAARQAIADYLDGLQPEEKADEERIRQIAAAQQQVLRVALDLGEELKAERGRVVSNKVAAHPYEKIFLAPPGKGGFEIVA